MAACAETCGCTGYHAGLFHKLPAVVRSVGQGLTGSNRLSLAIFWIVKAPSQKIFTGVNDPSMPCVYLSPRYPSGVTSDDRANGFLSWLDPVDKLLQSDMLARHSPYLASRFDYLYELAFPPCSCVCARGMHFSKFTRTVP